MRATPPGPVLGHAGVHVVGPAQVVPGAALGVGHSAQDPVEAHQVGRALRLPGHDPTAGALSSAGAMAATRLGRW